MALPALWPHLKALIISLLAFAMAANAAEVERSVVQITVFGQQPRWDVPWQFGNVQRWSGSGFLIKGKKVMTNAHVAEWARQILIKRMGDSRPFLAKVAYVGSDCDLALLEVEDPRFYEGLEPLEIGDLPVVRSTVTTYGYPAGGEQISYTKGVVSRIELEPYVNIGNRSLLAVQTDAAINPGNSGGPVIQDDKVVGVAFQGQPGLENTGFFIPPNVMRHFLKDIEDGKYDGFPQAGIKLTDTFNPALRRELQLPDEEHGARIDAIVPDSTKEFLKIDDVVMQVGEYPVGSDGTITYKGNIVNMGMAVSEFQDGEKVPLVIWRDGKEMKIDLPVHVLKDDISTGNQYTLPRYFVYGGLVFTPLSRDYLNTLGRSWMESVSQDIIAELFYRRDMEPDKKRTEPVMLADVLSNPVNANFEIKGRVMVDKINGIRIDKLEDVIRAFESNTNAEHLIQFSPMNHLEGLDRAAADKANQDILQQFGIPSDRRL
ncbi:trypsin-like serine protease [bacterium]|nr:trypsin-like serine protease [bacterium]